VKNHLSLIRLTVFKNSFLVTVIIILLYFFIAKIYWNEEVTLRKSELQSAAANTGQLILENYPAIFAVKQDIPLNLPAKKEKINELLRAPLDMLSQQTKEIEIGFYDLELALAFFSGNSSVRLMDKISGQNPFQFFNGNQERRGVIVKSIPVSFNGETVGYSWAAINVSSILYDQWLRYWPIIIAAILLLLVILWAMRRSAVKIETSLNTFTKAIVDGQFDNPRVVKELPELQPVLDKLKNDLGSLQELNRKLEYSNDRLVTIMEGISDGLFSLDRNWCFSYLNDETKKTFGQPNKDLIGKNFWKICAGHIDHTTEAHLRKAMEENQQKHWNTKSLFDDKYYEYHTYPFAQGLTVFVRDVTNDRKRDLEMLRLERLNLIGQMAAGISHEIRNPLTTVRGFLQMLAAKSDSSKNKEYMDLMISEIDRTNEIITDFLSLSKVSSESMSLHNINKIITRVHPLLQADAFNSDKDIILELNEVPEVRVDDSEIRQLILNLVRNGLEETPEGGYVSIRTYFIKSDEEAGVVLAIQDQGKGIPKEIQDKLGTPFFTTKEKGTGLGLAISMGIASRHKAKFEYQTGEQGTTFFVVFPVPENENAKNGTGRH